jgi:hypothetical protein
MDELKIFKNDWESIVVEWRGQEVGYISVGKKNYVVTLHLQEYYAKLMYRNSLKSWIYGILKQKEHEMYSIVALEKKGFKILS